MFLVTVSCAMPWPSFSLGGLTISVCLKFSIVFHNYGRVRAFIPLFVKEDWWFRLNPRADSDILHDPTLRHFPLRIGLLRQGL